MIDSAITQLSVELNSYLRNKFDLNEDVVIVSNIMEQDGTVSPEVNNRVVVSLVNIEKDTVPFRVPADKKLATTRLVSNAQPVFFNLYLVFSSCFSGNNYKEGLKFISNTISFFQGQPVFDHQNTPGMDKGIDKLILDIENMNMHDLSGLWGMLSGKYLPSILYKVRMVTYDSARVRSQEPLMSEPLSGVNL